MLHYFVHRSDRKRYTAAQIRQARTWTVIAAMVIVTLVMLAAH